MRKLFKRIVCSILMLSSILFTNQIKASAAGAITRSQAENRALNMINLTWTYDRSENSNVNSNYTSYVTQPSQLNNTDRAQEKGIPYNWGGQDSLDSHSLNAPWDNFLEAINRGAFAGNVDITDGYSYIPGTAGIDCSGFVQAVFNIDDYKISTSTMFDKYFKRIDLNSIKHMDILDRPGDHVVIFDRWGTLDGISGAFTYESTPDTAFGGIMGTKQYFVTMDDINNGYIPGRYINIVDDNTIQPHIFAQISNVNSFANFRSLPDINSNIIGTLPKGAIVYLIDYSSGWYQIKYGNNVGWVFNSLLSPIQSGQYVTVINAYQLNIRSNPDFGAAIVGTLNVGQYAKVIDYSSDGNFYKIQYNGITGWASRKYLNYIY